MASSWNKGTLVDSSMSKVDVAVESASKGFQESSSLFMSVIDDAARAMQQGGEAVSEAAASVYDFIPEAADVVDTAKGLSKDVMEGVEKASKEAADIAFGSEKDKSIQDQISDIPEPNLKKDLPVIEPPSLAPLEKISKITKLANTTAGKLLTRDLLSFDFEKKRYTITEKDFQQDEINFIKELAKKYGATLIKKDMIKGVEFGDVRGGNVENLSDIELSLADRVYNSLGDFTIVKDEKTGEYFVEDTYDWNIYTDYTDLSAGVDPDTGRPRGKVYTTEEFESKFNRTEALLATWNSDASQFEKIHNTAFLFGSRDYKDPSKDTGIKVRINLGKLD